MGEDVVSYYEQIHGLAVPQHRPDGRRLFWSHAINLKAFGGLRGKLVRKLADKLASSGLSSSENGEDWLSCTSGLATFVLLVMYQSRQVEQKFVEGSTRSWHRR